MERNIIKDTGFNLENTYSETLPEVFYSYQYPAIVREDNLVLFNEELAKNLGLNIDVLKSEEGRKIFSGKVLIENSNPIAQAYAGHQFGHFTMLGDGRAVLLGEHIVDDKRYDVQLKGSGLTPYSRGGDGKASLGPMIREYIISESMNSLNIRTSRSLAVIKTSEEVFRIRREKGAILTRIASSHIRVGTFEFAARLTSYEELKALADYTIKRHYKEGKTKENPYLYLLERVVDNGAKLVAKWMAVGFIHGVMNTDNITISGETIDYGPCAFMDEYNKNTVFSSIDTQGRYSYFNQPNIMGWDLARFAESLIPLLNEDSEKAINIAKEVISNYIDLYKKYYIDEMRKKLGLLTEEKDDESLIYELLDIMEVYKADYTNTFIALTLDKEENEAIFYGKEFKMWKEKWKNRIESQGLDKNEVQNIMKKSNPYTIPRNYRVEEAIKEAVENDDYTYIHKLLEAMKNTYEYNEKYDNYKIVEKDHSKTYRTYCGT